MEQDFANELERTLTGESYAAPPSHILEGIDETLAHRVFPHAPRTIYSELWHITFWQKISLDWVRGNPTPHPVTAAQGFPTQVDVVHESWRELCARFARTNAEAAAIAREPSDLETVVRCPSPPGNPERTMTVREQLESLTAHNAYHLGRIVLMRQMAGSWPPPSGGFTW
jgi:uncharacterized damage-inducible protein DinB